MKSSRRYSVIFYGCLLIAVVLVGAMLFSDRSGSSQETVYTRASVSSAASTAVSTAASTAASTGPLTLRWSAEQLRDLMRTAVEGQTEGITVDRVTLTAPDTVSVSGTMSRALLEELLEASELEAKKTLLLALRLLPEELSVGIAFSAAAGDGTLAVTPLSLHAESITLPASLLPQELTDGVNAAIRDALEAQHCTLESLFISGEVLYLTCFVG